MALFNLPKVRKRLVFLYKSAVYHVVISLGTSCFLWKVPVVPQVLPTLCSSY